MNTEKNDNMRDKQHTDKKKADLDKIIDKRNNRLVNLFKLMDLPVRIMGDVNNPAIIYDDRIKIKAYVHNFELRFMDVDDDRNEDGSRKNIGKCIYMIKLLEKPIFDKNKVLECINHQPICYVSKVILNKINPMLPLYVVGYDYEEEIKYPVFANSPNSHLRSMEDALKVVDKFKKDGYDLDIINEEGNINVVLKSKPTLYLRSFRYLNEEEVIGKYPVFSAYSSKLYFSEQRAIEDTNELKNDGYDCGVIVAK